jgi:rod shape-determining protein MreD
MPSPIPNPLRDFGKPKINRGPSALLAVTLPWVVVMLGSLSPTWPVIASAPIIPPLGFLLLIAWQHVRPGLIPVWAGLPLGLFDDLFSGQPFGSGVMLWSLAMIGLDIVETRLPWRGFAQNWLFAAGVIVVYLVLALLLANVGGGNTMLWVLAPQAIVSVFAYPLAARLVGAFDRLRLIPIVAV